MGNHSSGMEPRNHSPIIDQRNRSRLIEQIKKMAPFYAPEWRFRPEDPDPGTALALMFVHLLEGNIRRLNQVPYKNFLAFLNRFHVEIAQARPALTQVTFRLAEGTPDSVFVDKGAQLAAEVLGEEEPIIFETARPILLTNAQLLDMLTISPKRDRIVKIAEEDTWSSLRQNHKGTAIYGIEGDNLQEHTMYIRHDFLFVLEHPSFLELAISNAQNEYAIKETVGLLSDTTKVIWEYYHGGEWIAFDRVYGHRSLIRLIKLNKLSLDSFEYEGMDGHWIRCRAYSLDERSGGASLSKVQFDRVLIKSEFAAATDEDGMLPERLYFNDMQIDAEDSCEPFGDFFAPYGLFYISNREALCKRGAHISIRFDLEFKQHRFLPDKPPAIHWKPIMKRHEIDKTEIPDLVTIANVQWEYWNGSAWVMLDVQPESRALFSVPWEGVQERELSFVCPEDMQEIGVNAEENYWIRGRIVQIQNAYSPNAIYCSPHIKNMRIRYGYDRPVHPPEQIVMMNNLERKDRTNEVSKGGTTVRPFLTLEGSEPSVWFGYDLPPERGPIHLHVMLKQRYVTAEDVPFIEWEYLKQRGGSSQWAPLAVADDTNGFTQSGDIQFVGPQDFALETHFGLERYWIRAVNRDGRYDHELETTDVPRLLNVLLNTTLAVQQRTIINELPQRSESYNTAEEGLTEYYILAETPVLSEEVWVDETAYLSREEAEQFQREGEDIEIIVDSEGEVLRIWARYYEVEHFLRTESHDRHYTMDRATGRMSFGNSRAGNSISRSGEDTVRVTYTAGGGKRGNVLHDTITSMQDSIAFIDGVTNHYAAAGGCDAGTLEEAIIRGPKLFTHLNRAVIAEDFEWLARQAHPNVAKVKCLPNVNVKLEKQPGAITIVVLPNSGIGDGAHFQELKRKIENSLITKAASNIAFPGRIQVMEPALLEIGVQVTVWVKHMDDVVPVEREIIHKLNQFLHTLTGNTDGQGWEIGQIVHHSMFYALLKSVGPVVHIPQLSLDVYKMENGERMEWNPEKISELPHSIVVAGEHHITVELSK